MEKLKKLIPLFLVLGMVLSIYMLVDTRMKTAKEYDEILAAARQYAEEGIVAKSVQAYKGAIEMKESLPLYLEMAEMLLSNERYNDAMELSETLLSKFPREASVYGYTARLYYAQDLIKDFFDLVDKADGRRIINDELNEIYGLVKYEYELGYSGYDDIGTFGSDFWPAMRKGYWGFLSAYGSQKIDFRYAEASSFVGEWASVKEEDGTVYYINTSGEKISAPKDGKKFDKLGLASSPIAMSENGKYGFYNDGYEYLFGDYDFAGTFNYGFAAVKKGTAWSFVDMNGQILQDKTFGEIALDGKDVAFRNGAAFAENGSSWIMIDTSGNPIGANTYQDAKPFLSDAPAAVKVNGKWGFVDANGNMVVEPSYADAHSFSGGFAAVNKDGLWGFINEKGELCIDFTFDDVKDFNEIGITFVITDGAWYSLSLLSKNH